MHPIAPRRLLPSALALFLGTWLSACSSATDVPAPTAPEGAASQESAAPAAPADTELNLYAWSEYVPQEVLDSFGEQSGVTVNYDTYASNEELLARLEAGNAQYDVIIPSDYLVGLLAQKGMLLALDKGAIPNAENLDPAFLNPPWDAGNRFTLPYQWGTTGIVVNTAKVSPPITSFADLWRADLKDRLVAPDDQREMLGIGLEQLGHDRNSRDPEQLAAARDKLIELRPNIRVFDSDSPKTQLLSGEVDAGIVYNGEAALAARENPDMAYILAPDGCGIWFDNLAIPAGAPHPQAAHAFINHVLAAEQSALITRDYPYSNPNRAGLANVKETMPEVWAAYEASPATNPTAEQYGGCEAIEDVGEALPLYGDMWTEVKGGG